MYPGIICHKRPILRQYLYFLVRGLLFTSELQWSSSSHHFESVWSPLRKSVPYVQFVVVTIPSALLHSQLITSNSTGSTNEEVHSGLQCGSCCSIFSLLSVQCFVDGCVSFFHFFFGYWDVCNSVYHVSRYPFGILPFSSKHHTVCRTREVNHHTVCRPREVNQSTSNIINTVLIISYHHTRDFTSRKQI